MCGLAGFTGLKNPEARLNLITGFGPYIDRRGYMAAGFVTSNEAGEVTVQRKIGGWSDAIHSDKAFIKAAASGDMCMMHSRGPRTKAITDAHPFPVVRNGETVLWGAHNGELANAWISAREHGRQITVDSMELFELIADGEFNQLNKMGGWGVATWVEMINPRQVKLASIFEYAELVAVALEGGGVAWASTQDILNAGLENAGLKIREQYRMRDNVGRVFIANEDGLFATDETRIHLAPLSKY